VEEEDNKHDDDGKEPRMIGQGEIVNTSVDDSDTMVDNEPTVLPEQGQKMREHTPWPQPQAPDPRPWNLEPTPRPSTPETHALRGLEFLGLVTPQKPLPAGSTLPEAEAAENTSDVDVDQQLRSESACGDSLSDVPLPVDPLPDASLLDVCLPHDLSPMSFSPMFLSLGRPRMVR